MNQLPDMAGEADISIEASPFTGVVAAVDGNSPFTGVYAGAVLEADAAAADGGAFDISAVGGAVGFAAEFIFIGEAGVVFKPVVLVLPPGADAGYVAVEAVDVVVAAGVEGITVQVGVEEPEVGIETVSMAPVQDFAEAQVDGIVHAVRLVVVSLAFGIVENILRIVRCPAEAEGRFFVGAVRFDPFPEDTGSLIVNLSVTPAVVEGAVRAVTVVVEETIFRMGSVFFRILHSKTGLAAPDVCGDMAAGFIAVLAAADGGEGLSPVFGLIQVLHGVQHQVVRFQEGCNACFIAHEHIMGLGLGVHIRIVDHISILQERPARAFQGGAGSQVLLSAHEAAVRETCGNTVAVQEGPFIETALQGEQVLHGKVRPVHLRAAEVIGLAAVQGSYRIRRSPVQGMVGQRCGVVQMVGEALAVRGNTGTPFPRHGDSAAAHIVGHLILLPRQIAEPRHRSSITAIYKGPAFGGRNEGAGAVGNMHVIHGKFCISIKYITILLQLQGRRSSAGRIEGLIGQGNGGYSDVSRLPDYIISINASLASIRSNQLIVILLQGISIKSAYSLLSGPLTYIFLFQPESQ